MDQTRPERSAKAIGDEGGIDWNELFVAADAAIKQTIAELPAEVKAIAEAVPYVLDKWCPNGRALGQFGGYTGAFTPGQVSQSNGPIFLYLGNHFHYCAAHQLDFTAQIRRTYLHELCHHFGLEEEDCPRARAWLIPVVELAVKGDF